MKKKKGIPLTLEQKIFKWIREFRDNENYEMAKTALRNIDKLCLLAANKDVLIQEADTRGNDLYNDDTYNIDDLTAKEIAEIIINT